MTNSSKTASVSPALELAAGYFQSGRLAEAEAACRKILAATPENPDAFHLLGVIANTLGDYKTAATLLRQAIAISENDPFYHSNLGLALQNGSLPEEAIAEYTHALALKPDLATAHINIGNILKTQGKFDAAEARYRQAITADPKLALAHYNLAGLLQSQKKPEAAIAAYSQAIILDPAFAAAHINLGVLFKDQGKLEEAVTQYKQAISINPRLSEAYSNLGVALTAQKKTAEAIEQFEQAVALAPNNTGMLAQLVHRLQHAGLWDKATACEKKLLEMVREGREGIPPFFVLNTASTPAEQLVCARGFSRKFTMPPEATFRHIPAKSEGRIRIGYLSADFHHHATAFLMAELFERHDRARFNVTAYSYGPDDGSDMRRRLMSAFEHFVDIRDMPHAAAAQKIYDDGIDILIDLKGCTEESRLQIPAYRPAPVQINYLGYPGTMGVDFIDYIIADPFVLPPDQQPFYVEKIIHLPDSYQPNDTHRRIAETKLTRSDCGLPEQGFVFCCFNQSYKIKPEIFDIWMRLLQATPDSVLWLLESNAMVKDNLRNEAMRRGIEPARLVFAPHMQLPDHLARHQLADLFLDTLPINAHTTASDALWAGLPVLTCAGTTFAGRVAGSLLKAADLSELITYSLEDYEALALQLAQNPAQLSAIRQKLQQTRLQIPLFDIEKYTKNIEDLYQTVWDRWQAASLMPDSAEACNSFAIALSEQEKFDEAETMYRHAISIDPANPLPYFNLGNLFKRLEKPDKALEKYAEAITVKPDFVAAYINMGSMLEKLGMMDEAVLLYAQAQALRPDDPKRLAELVHFIYHACAWDKLGDHEARLLEMVRQGREEISPFTVLGLASTAEDQLICARAYSHSSKLPPQALFTHTPRKSGERIKIGYLSADYWNHATAHLMAELFERHDRARFAIIGYSYGQDDKSPLRERLIKAFDSFIDLRALSDHDAAQKIYDDGVDILIDLKGGYTTDSRLGIPAYRPAPLQVNYLGFPGTMGADFIDYIIADRFIIPEDQEKFYSEKVVCLPDCYQSNDTLRKIAETTPTREACGLPSQGFVFCSFNANYKITPQIFDIWMRLLQKVPGSVLWLIESNKSAKGNLQREAKRCGVDPDRIIFASKMSTADHLARHRLADLFLDTLPINAHTTTSDALWAGLPVLTCAGGTFAGRVAGSLLKAANLPELVTYTLEDYEALALHLAQNPASLSEIRQKLARTRLQVPLFDIGSFVKNIEKSYQTMWEIRLSGKNPKAFAVT